MLKRIRLISLLVFLIQTSFLSYPYAYGETDALADRIVVIVNKDTITQSEVDAFLNLIIMQLSQRYQGKELQEKIEDEKKELITRMLEERIIGQEAKRKQLKPRVDMVKKRLEQLKKGYASSLEFDQALMARGLTIKDLEKGISEQMMIQGLIEQEVRSKIIVAPSEVTEYYQKHKEDLLQPEIRTVESLYFEDENTARKINETLKTEADFKQIAEYYKVAYAKDALARPQLKPEIQETIFSLKLNEVSGPIRLNEGIYLFKLLEIRPEERKSLSEVHQQIYNYIFEQKLNLKLIEWLEDLKSKAYISYKR